MKYFNFLIPGLRGDEELTLSVDGVKYPLLRHTEDTRRMAMRTNRAMAMMTDGQLREIGFYAMADAESLSPDRLHRVTVTSKPRADDPFTLPILHHISFYLPARCKKAYLLDRKRQGMEGTVFWDAKLSMLNLDRDRAGELGAGRGAEQAVLDVNLDIDLVLTPMEIAKSLLFEHPNLASAQPHTAAIVMNSHIAPPREYNPKQYQRLYDFATAISKQGPDKWAFRTFCVNQKTGRPMEYGYDIPELDRKKGDRVEIYDLSARTLDSASGALRGALSTASQDADLRNQTWHVKPGRTARCYSTDSMEGVAGRTSGENELKWVVKEDTPHHGLSVMENSIRLQDRKFQIEVQNSYLRTLGAFVQYLDDSGNPFGKKEFNSIVGPVDTLMGIPLPFAASAIEAELPEEAAGIRLYFGGLGTSGYDPDLCVTGIVLTAVFQLGIPTFFLAADAGLISTKVLTDSMKKASFVKDVIDTVLNVVQSPVYSNGSVSMIYDWLEIAAKTIAGIMVTEVMEEILAWIIGQITAQEAEECIPIAGWILRIANVVIDVAQLTQTVVEVCTSPAVLTADVTRYMDLKATVCADPAHGEQGKPETAVWPAVADSWQLSLVYRGGTSRVVTGRFPASSSREPVVNLFTGVPAGGLLKVSFHAYSKTGWLCGGWESGWMDAKPGEASGVMEVSGSIKEVLVSLTRDVQYEYKEKLVYENGAYLWHSGDRPEETLADIGNGSGECLQRLSGITYSSACKQAGYVWSASGSNLPPAHGESRLPVEYMAQNISTLSDTEVNRRFKASEIGFGEQPCIVYDKSGAGSGNYILDTRNGKCHLRKVDLMDGTHGFGFSDRPMPSYGRFMQNHMDALVVHPDGAAIGVNWKNNKIEILHIPKEPSQDSDAAEAQMIAGEGFREGLVNGPVAVKITEDGRILILESGNRRIQGFDIEGNPVPGFAGKKLFCAPESQIKEDLDREQFSGCMKELFRQNGLALLCALDDKSQVKALDENRMTKELVHMLSEKGVYIYYEDDDPEAGARVETVEKGSAWDIKEPVRGLEYRLKAEGDAIAVYDGLSQMAVTAAAAGKRWVLRDMVSGKSYLALTGGTEGTVDFFEYLSYMMLCDRGTNDTYLDFCVEDKGYIYVLSYDGAGSRQEDYHMDIYEPGGGFLVRTPDERLSPDDPQYINAAKMEVDEFRNLMTLNFERIAGQGGKPEPSVSRYTPTTPLFQLDKSCKKEFEDKDMAAVKKDFADHGINLTDQAVLTDTADNVYQIRDTQTFHGVTGKVVFDVILCVDEYMVYEIAGKEDEIWKRKI